MTNSTIEFRAFLAGASAMSFAQAGQGAPSDVVVSAVESMLKRQDDASFEATAQIFKDWLKADEKQQSDILEAQPGAAKLSLPVPDWTPAEMIQAVTSLSTYRAQLAREQRSLDEFFSCLGIQSNPAYKYAAENAGVIASERCISIDPISAGKLWKRMQSESLKLLEAGALEA